MILMRWLLSFIIVICAGIWVNRNWDYLTQDDNPEGGTITFVEKDYVIPRNLEQN